MDETQRHGALTLETGDFVLLPEAPGFTISSFEPMTRVHINPKVTSAPTGEVRHGTRAPSGSVTGHKEWRMPRRYTNLKAEDLHKLQKKAQQSPEEHIEALIASATAG